MILHTSPRSLSRLNDDVSSRIEKTCFLKLNSTRDYCRLRGLENFSSQKQATSIKHCGESVVSLNGEILMVLAVQVNVVDLQAISTFQTVYNCFLQQQMVEPQKSLHLLLILWSGT